MADKDGAPGKGTQPDKASAPVAEAAPGANPRRPRIIAVGSGKGGVGKSTLSANLAVALGRLPAAFTSLVIFLEAVAAAGLGALLLGEPVSAAQALGGVLILAGIYVARPGEAL